MNLSHLISQHQSSNPSNNIFQYFLFFFSLKNYLFNFNYLNMFFISKIQEFFFFLYDSVGKIQSYVVVQIGRPRWEKGKSSPMPSSKQVVQDGRRNATDRHGIQDEEDKPNNFVLPMFVLTRTSLNRISSILGDRQMRLHKRSSISVMTYPDEQIKKVNDYGAVHDSFIYFS